MRFKLKEDEILEFLDLNFPQQTFEKVVSLLGKIRDNHYTFIILEKILGSFKCKF